LRIIVLFGGLHLNKKLVVVLNETSVFLVTTNVFILFDEKPTVERNIFSPKVFKPTFRRLVSKVNNIFGKRNRGKTEYGDVQGLS